MLSTSSLKQQLGPAQLHTVVRKQKQNLVFRFILKVYNFPKAEKKKQFKFTEVASLKAMFSF